MAVSLVKRPVVQLWAVSVFNACTLEYVVTPSPVDGWVSRDDAKRDLQAWLISEADAMTDDDEATMLDDAAQRLNYGDTATIGGTFDWIVGTVLI